MFRKLFTTARSAGVHATESVEQIVLELNSRTSGFNFWPVVTVH